MKFLTRIISFTVAAAAITSCSGTGSATDGDTSAADSLDFISRYGYAQMPDSMEQSLSSALTIMDMTWDSDGVTMDYKRMYARAATPDSGTYIDMVCDYIPANTRLSDYAARQLDAATQYVRFLDNDSSLIPAPTADHPVVSAARHITSDFTGRVFREINADTALIAHEQYGIADVLINYISPRVITYSTYSVYYMAGAVNPMEVFDLQSFDRSGDCPLSLEDIAAPGKVADVRAALLSQIVKTEKYASASDYIDELNRWQSDTGQPEITAEEFPVYSLGLTHDGLTFAYPKYTIAPGSRGVPVYTVPYSELKGLIRY